VEKGASSIGGIFSKNERKGRRGEETNTMKREKKRNHKVHVFKRNQGEKTVPH